MKYSDCLKIYVHPTFTLLRLDAGCTVGMIHILHVKDVKKKCILDIFFRINFIY